MHVLAKIRRLYDIANVLKSLQLIKKEKLIDSGVRKAAFRWISYKPANLPQFYPGKSQHSIFFTQAV